MNDLIHLIYSSQAAVLFSYSEILELLSKVRNHNKEIDVTGMLLHCESSFFQVLEGPKENVEELFKLISKDSRHKNLTIIIKETIYQRAFSEWSMAYADASLNEIKKIEGLNDFFIEGTCLSEIDMGRSKKLLKAFSAGRWRQTLK